MSNIKFELCIDSISSLRNAIDTPIDRIELCSALFEGGLTPRNSKIALFVLIRPRGGDFLYSEEEMQVMIEDIRAVKTVGADGVVIGMLRADGSVDVTRTRLLVQEALPMQVTFHRAFDMAKDAAASLDAVISIGNIQRLLTSGQANSAFEGADLLATLVERAKGRIAIMPGGGVTDQNIEKILRLTGAREVHFSLRKAHSSDMQYRASGVYMGGVLRPEEFSNSVADPNRIRLAARAAAKL